jgi:hypothetical protein
VVDAWWSVVKRSRAKIPSFRVRDCRLLGAKHAPNAPGFLWLAPQSQLGSGSQLGADMPKGIATLTRVE